MLGRKKPYSLTEIALQKCPCGRPALYQWNCCALDNRWVPVCLDCDVGMNEMVLAFFRVPGRGKLINDYRKATRCPA